MTKLVLCATQRCGSTMIVEDMRNSGVLGMPEEWFVPWNPAKPDVDWSRALHGVHRRGTGPNGIFAIKVMANQLHNVEACLENVVESRSSGLYPRFATLFEGAAWIKLTRRDIVEQAISRVMSQQTGINHATRHADDPHFAGNLARGYDDGYNRRTIYRYSALLREVTSILLENLAWDRFFESHGIIPREFVYEEVARDPGMGHLDVIGRLAGLAEPVPRAERRMVKLANAKNAEWKELFFAEAAANNFRQRPLEKG